MHLERWHRTLKGIFLEGKNVKRLDKSLRGLMLFTTEQLFKRLRTLNFGAVSSKICELRKRHKVGLTLDLLFTKKTDIEENLTYLVASEKSALIYEVQFNNTTCKCKLKCEDCKQCVHTISCSCPDYLIRLNMCKHIHYLVSKLPKEASCDEPGDTLLCAPLAIVEKGDEAHEADVYVAEISVNNKQKARLSHSRDELIAKTVAHLQSLSSQNEIDAAAKVVQMLEPATIAAKLCDKSVQSFVLKDISPNRIALKQKRYKSVKKKCKKSLRMTRSDDTCTMKMLLASNSSQSKV